MASIINIPYLTSGTQMKQNDKSKNLECKKISQNQDTQINDKIIKRRHEYLKLSGAFKDAYNYRTFKSTSS